MDLASLNIETIPGPMMRAHNPMFMQHGGPRQMGAPGFQRAQNMVVPEMSMGSQQEWRQVMIQQQQSMSFNSSQGNIRPGFSNVQGKCSLSFFQ